MGERWTGGQYSLYRLVFGLFLLVQFVQLLSSGTEVLAAGGALASLLLAVGCRDRVAAVLVWFLWMFLCGRHALLSHSGLQFVALLLIVHALLPAAPYGSLQARGRLDPDGGWRMNRRLFTAVWILMAVGYAYGGYTRLISPTWQDGTALLRLLEGPLCRSDLVRGFALTLPAGLLEAFTYAVLLAVLAFAPLALFRCTRPWIWGLLLWMHLLIG